MTLLPPLRIDLPTLHRIARDTAARRAATQPGIRSAYLVGSVAANEPLLGNSTDIDLILIHDDPPESAREIVRLSDEVVLDITHHGREHYATPRELRSHPWRGPEMCEPVFLHDPTHFFERVQASTRGLYHQADYVAARARAFNRLALTAYHRLDQSSRLPTPANFRLLGNALLSGANAVLSLIGFPAAARKLMLKFDGGVNHLGCPELYHRFLDTLGAGDLSPEDTEALLPPWRAAYQAASAFTRSAPFIHPDRLTYYASGFHAIINSGRPRAPLWPLLMTWAAAVETLQQNAPGEAAPTHLRNWRQALARLGMETAAGFAERRAALREFLLACEAEVERWARKNGI